MPAMKAHDHVKFPDEGVKLQLTPVELEFILSMMTRVHVSLLDRVKNKALPQEERKEAYDYALSTENMYAAIFSQLKLYRPERKDLH